MLDPTTIDIRLAVGQPDGERPIMLTCPRHRERIGSEDDRGSLAVYRSQFHCYGCQWHTSKRYASLAFLLGAWDGRGREDGPHATEAVRSIKPRLKEFVSGMPGKQAGYVPPLDPYQAESFHRYL